MLLDQDKDNSTSIKPLWPFKEEGYALIYATVSEPDRLVAVHDVPAIFSLIKMGFFGFNSNKEINYYYLYDASNKMTLGSYELKSVEIPKSLEKFEQDVNRRDEVSLWLTVFIS